MAFFVILMSSIALAGTSAVFAATTSDIYFNVNASDPGSYNASSPGTWTDLSAANRNGTINGSVTYNSSNSSLVFPGNANAYVDMGAGFNSFGTGITIEFEAHFGPTVDQGWERIFDFGNGPSSDNIWVGAYGGDPNDLAIELFHGSVRKGYCVSAVNALTANTFAKYTITLDGSLCRMYVNGSEINTRAGGYGALVDDSAKLGSTYTSVPSVNNRTKNYIGKSNWSADPAFNGSIKYVRIYTSALTSSEVTTNSTSYTLTYSTTGSTSGSAPAYQAGNGLVTLSGNTGALSKTGHTFAGWAASANQTTAISGTYNLSADTTLYPAFTPNNYTVTYEENGGSLVPDGTFTHDGSLVYPNNPVKVGNTFMGWALPSSTNVSRTATEISAGNASVTLQAMWSPNTYYVAYDEHGGSPVADGSYVFGNSLAYPAPPTRLGYAFLGWFASQSGGVALTASEVSAGTSDVNLHAQWAVLPAQVVTWAPTNTTVMTSHSPLTPQTLATTNGGGQITYAVVDAGSTGCSVNSSTGVLTYSGVGTCTVRATAAANSNYLSDDQDVVFNIGASSPAVSLNLELSTGATVANSVVAYGASGLQNNSSWSLVLRSTPQTLISGTFTSTLLSGSTQIPAGLSAGWHSITFTGVTSSGATISHAVWFEVSSTGTLLQTSGTGPSNPVSSEAVGLAHTGVSAGSLSPLAGLLLVVMGFAGIYAARKRPEQIVK
ncbi:MAG: hypothetical protein RL720_502 [Actinomycetota bacterium]|jgi:uncharacterized repeat protein (TIGR02543 family)